MDALMGCGTTSMPELAGGKEGKCECAALGGEAELEESGRCCAAWCEYRPDISWSCSSRPPSDPAAVSTIQNTLTFAARLLLYKRISGKTNHHNGQSASGSPMDCEAIQ